MSEQNMIKPEIHEALVTSLQQQRDRALNESVTLKAELILLQKQIKEAQEKKDAEQTTNKEEIPKDKK